MNNNFEQITRHCYTALNQNGLNNALYHYFSATDNGTNNTRSKKSVREMVQDIPPHFPISFVIVDLTFECGRIHLEFFDK